MHILQLSAQLDTQTQQLIENCGQIRDALLIGEKLDLTPVANERSVEVRPLILLQQVNKFLAEVVIAIQEAEAVTAEVPTPPAPELPVVEAPAVLQHAVRSSKKG